MELAPDEVSGLGFSADDAVAWFGDTATVEVTWTGRHSRTPPEDTVDIAVGPITGTLRFTLQGLDLDAAQIVGEAADVVLSEARWAEVDAAVGSELAPPERIALSVTNDPRGDTVAISAEGPDYVLSVWKCNEHVKGECAGWE